MSTATPAPKQPKTDPQQELEQAKKVLKEQEKTIHDYTDHLKRLQADFENYMKRTHKEQQIVEDAAINKAIHKLLFVVDDFQHTMAHLKEEAVTKEEIVKGVDMIFTKLHKFLEDEGVRPIDTNGKRFDPAYHEALLLEQTNNAPENTILEELQRGYTRKDTVIRYAKVKIAKPALTKSEGAT
ncbi:nucleotide exchange factor GrpE [Candidatus Woesearchaeota archaeon]|nr:nucleotide exchange factor GrpE [Candidatus Woesearchaeota archaeon]